MPSCPTFLSLVVKAGLSFGRNRTIIAPVTGEQVSRADSSARSRSRRSRGRRYGWLVVLGLVGLVAWVLNVSRPGTRVEGCLAGCAAAGPRRDGPLRVMSLNVLHGFPRFAHLPDRLDLIAAEIRHQDADLVLLQEVPWHWGSAAHRLAEATGMNYAYVRANGNRWTLLFEEGEAILSRYPLRDAAMVELMPRAGFFEHRRALRATAITPWGAVGVVSTHLTHGEPAANRAQAASLAAFVADGGGGPLLVGGDFNATEDEPQIRELGWIDAYRAVHPLSLIHI